MDEQILRDASGRILGRIRRLGNGRYEARDRSGRFLGTYDPGTNRTRNARGALVGSGNLLAALITCT